MIIRLSGKKKIMGQKSSPSRRLGYENRYQRDFAEQIWVHRRTADSNPGLPAVEPILYTYVLPMRQSPQVS
jgi:hypothetical protein